MYRRYLRILLLLFAGFFFILTSNSYIDIGFLGSVSLSANRQTRKSKGIINTEGCTIPDMDPMDPSVAVYVKYPKVPECHNSSLALLERNRTTIWVREENFYHYNITEADDLACCYRVFYRPDSADHIILGKVDDRVKYDDCILFNDYVEVDVSHEFVRVNCSVNDDQVYEQFYLFAPMKNFTKHGKKDEIMNKTGYNILIVGVDSVSRLNLIRTMPKMVKYLQTKGAIDMLGYNKVGYNTFPNLIPMLLGVKDTELDKLCYPNIRATFDNCPFVWEWYKQAGYYTAFAEDMTHYSTFNYLKRGFMVAPTDYYPRTLLVQAEEFINAGEKICMNDMYYYKVLLNYMEDVTWQLQSKRLFGLFWQNSISHDNLNWPMKIDKDYVRMFINLEASGYLEESIVFFVSDHGMRWGKIRSTKQGLLEELLPFLYVMIPSSWRKNNTRAYNNLRLNRQRLTTPFDVHETLMDLIKLKNVKDDTILQRSLKSYALQRGISLFLPIPSNRTCKNAGIDDRWCSCNREVQQNASHARAVEGARLMLEKINYELAVQPLCADLELSEILEAREIQVAHRSTQWSEYIEVVRTAPGDALFEGLLLLEEGELVLKDMPSRINRYGAQSRCVDDAKLKAYCYCL